MKIAGIMQNFIKCIGLREVILNDEVWLISVLTSKLINKNIYNFFSHLFENKR